MEQLGARLRAAREARGITLEKAEEETRIRRKYIEALENGRRSDLPGEVYLKGFLRTYGNYVGLDGEVLVEEYKAVTGRSKPPEQERVTPSPVLRTPANTQAVEPAPAATARRSRQQKAQERQGSPPILRRSIILLLVLAALAGIGYLGWVIALQFSPAAETVDIASPPPSPESPPPEATPPPTPKLPDPPKVSVAWGTGQEVLFSVPAKELTVRLEFSPGERLWMRALVDDKQVYEGFPTESLEFVGRKIQLRMGHMQGVSLVVNGQRFEKPLDGGPFTLFFAGQS